MFGKVARPTEDLKVAPSREPTATPGDDVIPLKQAQLTSSLE